MVKILNLYYMMAYAFKTLHKKDYQKLQTESFDNALDLYAAILSIGLNELIKSGLLRDYIEFEEATTAPKGRLDISKSIKTQSLINKKIVCHKDEYTENILLNQILKSVSIHLMKSNEVSKQYKTDLRKALVYLNHVDTIDIHTIHWSRITYYRNNLVYKMLINVCYLAVQGMIQGEMEGSASMIKFMDNQKLHDLFEKFVLKYYQKHYPEYRPSAPHIDWNTDDGVVDFLPTMKTDITLTHENRTLIIDTKLYNKMMQNNWGKETQHSGNLYQIYAYVKNRDKEQTGNVSGMLLYAQTEKGQHPDKVYNMAGNTIIVRSIDLNQDFSQIKKQLNSVLKEI